MWNVCTPMLLVVLLISVSSYEAYILTYLSCICTWINLCIWNMCVMLLTIKDDTTSCFSLCHLFYMLSVIIISDYTYTRMCSYTIPICTDGAVMDMCLCLVSVTICMLCYWLAIHLWYASMWVLCNYRFLCHCSCSIISIHPPYNTVRYGVCVFVWFLPDDLLPLIVCYVVFCCVYLCNVWYCYNYVLIVLFYLMTLYNVMMHVCPID